MYLFEFTAFIKRFNFESYMRGNNERNYIVMQSVKHEVCAGGINATITKHTAIREAIIVDLASTLR